MEEVWNDINLSSFHQYNDNATSTRSLQTFHFQDFFSSKVDPSPPTTTNDTSFAGDRAVSSKQVSSVTSTTLSLNTPESGDHFQLGFGSLKETTNGVGFSPLDISLSRDHINTKKKRARVISDAIETSDQRSKRLMRSRESADRSRARKQAYTNGLEQEVARLRKENAKLRNRIAQFHLEVPVEVPKMPTLIRTLTTPF